MMYWRPVQCQARARRTSDHPSEAEPSFSDLPDCWSRDLGLHEDLGPGHQVHCLPSGYNDLDPRRIRDLGLLRELQDREVGPLSLAGQSLEPAGISGNMECQVASNKH